MKSPQKFSHSPPTRLHPAKYFIQYVTPGHSVILSGRIERLRREHLKKIIDESALTKNGTTPFSSHQSLLLNHFADMILLQVFRDQISHFERLVKPRHAALMP